MTENIVLTIPNERIGNVSQVSFTKHLRYYVNQLIIRNNGLPELIRIGSAFGSIKLSLGERFDNYGVIESISAYEHGISIITSGNCKEEFGILILITFSS